MKLCAKEEMYSKLSDNQLIALHKEGNMMVFEEICNRYGGLVKSICRQYFLVGGDFDDLLQEGFLGLLKAVNTYDGERQATFKTFAYTCISGNVKTAIKKACSKTNQPLNEAIPIEALRYFATENPEDEIIEDEGEEEFLKKLKTILSPFEYKVLSLWARGNSYAEISETTAKSVKSIDNAIQRIKKKLTENLK